MKRASAGGPRILDVITGILEGGEIARDYDRSELQEVLAAHAASADGAMARRWVDLCRKSLAEKGPEALHGINEGSLFRINPYFPKKRCIIINMAVYKGLGYMNSAMNQIGRQRRHGRNGHL